MADTTRQPLLGHQPRGIGASSVAGGGCLLLFGVPFIAAGIFIAALASGRVGDSGDLSELPRPLPYLIAAIFGLPGLFVSLTGARAMVRALALRSKVQAHPEEPWAYEFSWTREGVREAPRTTLLGQLGLALFLSIFLTPFNYFVFFSPEEQAPFFAKAIVVLFDLILVLVVVGVLYTIVQRARFGFSSVAFDSFPYFLGGRLSARLQPGLGIGRFDKMTLTLRCIEEVTETVRHGNKTTTSTRCEQVWSDSIEMAQGGSLGSDPIPFWFDLPSGEGLTTQLSASPSRYWELEAKAERPGVDYLATFLLPIYERPGAA